MESLFKCDEQEALKAARILFKNAKNAKSIKKGHSHDVYLVETGEKNPEKVLIRFANNNPIENSLKKELRVNQIFKENGFPVPEILLHDASKKIIKNEFVILSWLEGEDLDSVWDKLSNLEKEEILEQLGELMGKIHNIKFEKFGELLPEGILERGGFSLKQKGKSSELNPALFDHLSETFEFLGYMASFDEINKKFIAKAIDYLLENRELIKSREKPTMIHGDFYNNNFKVKKIDNHWVLTGMFDFEYSSAKLKEHDFIKIHRSGIFDLENMKKAFLKGYQKHQKIDEKFDERVQFLRICRDLGFVVILLKSGDKEFALKILNFIKDKIGCEEEVFV